MVKIADASISDSQRDQYISSYQTLVQGVADAVDGSTYNGQTLVGSAAGAVAATSKSVINNESGATTTLNAEDNSGTANALAALIGSTFTRSAAGVDAFGAVTAAAAQTAAAARPWSPAPASIPRRPRFRTSSTRLVRTRTISTRRFTFNTDKINSLNSGLGALVDADLSQESALLQSLQIKQQLGTQALSIANQAPQSLLSLFK